MEYQKQREDVAAFMRRLCDKGLTTCSGGNVSFRVDVDIMLITPSGKDKATLRPEDIIVYSLLEDRNLTPDLKPSMETVMHKSVYNSRSDVSSVVHAHPVYSSCYTATEHEINMRLIGEAVLILKNIEKVSYGLMGSKELAEGVSEKAKISDVLLLENHGVLTLGKTIFEAFDKIEVLENAAKMTLITCLIGKKKELEDQEIDKILKIFI